MMRTWRGGGRQDLLHRQHPGLSRLLRLLLRRRSYTTLFVILILISIASPLYFHYKLRHLIKVQMSKCGWIENPPIVCAHGGDSTTAFPNTVTAYLNAIRVRVDCIEIDVSRSSDGFLFALHDRDLQRISGNSTSKVGYLSKKEIQEMESLYKFRMKFQDQQVSTFENALMLVSQSVQHVILDVKVGPPSYEKGLADSILSIVEATQCTNCIVWAKSDALVRDIIRLSPNATVGYIVMKDQHVRGWVRPYLTRIEKAEVAGVYHPLIDENLMRILHGSKKKVFAWTVDDVASMESMLSKQVDGVVTSNPRLFQQTMEDVKIRCVEEAFALRRMK